MDPKDLVENIEVIEKSHTYQKGLKGAVDETGKALTTVGQAVNAALLPVQALVWCADQISSWMNESIAKKLEGVPPENIISPDPQIAGPAIEALKFTAQESELREMFASLLANSINKETSHVTHPAFVEIIKSMNHVDALVLKQLSKDFFPPILDIAILTNKKTSRFVQRNVNLLGVNAGLDEPWLSIASVENLERLGLCEIIKDRQIADHSRYEEILDHPDIKSIISKNTQSENKTEDIIKGGIVPTKFGEMFVAACVS